MRDEMEKQRREALVEARVRAAANPVEEPEAHATADDDDPDAPPPYPMPGGLGPSVIRLRGSNDGPPSHQTANPTSAGHPRAEDEEDDEDEDNED